MSIEQFDPWLEGSGPVAVIIREELGQLPVAIPCSFPQLLRLRRAARIRRVI